MTVVNKFNVNREQVTLDADIIENMSANDVSYNDSVQYSENTVGKKLSELKSEVIYDATANNNSESFESLQSLLNSSNLSTLIPTSVRHGGMSIRFVQSPDNKYVQYRLLSDIFSTTVSDWQGVDDEPTAGSENLMKSGSVYVISDKVDSLYGKTTQSFKSEMKYIDGTYWTIGWSNYQGCLFHVTPGYLYQIKAGVNNTSYAFIQEQEIVHGEPVLFASGYNKREISAGNETAPLQAPNDAAYLWIMTKFESDTTPEYVKIVSKVDRNTENIAVNKLSIDDINKSIGRSNILVNVGYIDSNGNVILNSNWKCSDLIDLDNIPHDYIDLMYDCNGNVPSKKCSHFYYNASQEAIANSGVYYGTNKIIINKNINAKYIRIASYQREDNYIKNYYELENIKYLNSDIGNVSDKIDNEVGLHIDMSVIKNEPILYDNNGKWMINNKDYQGVYFRCKPNQKFKIIASEANGFHYSFLKSTDSSSPDYCSGTSRYYISKEVIAIAPSDAEYIWIVTKYDGVFITPTVLIYGYTYQQIDDIYSRIDFIDNVFNGIDSYPSHDGWIDGNTSGKISKYDSSKVKVIPIKNRKNLYIRNLDKITNFILSTNYKETLPVTLNLATGETKRREVARYTEIDMTIPSDAQYLILQVTGPNNEDYIPSILNIDGYNIVNSDIVSQDAINVEEKRKLASALQSPMAISNRSHILNFIHTSDTHIKPNNGKCFSNLISLLGEDYIDCLIHTGDIVWNNFPSDNNDSAQGYAIFNKLLQNISKDVILSVGNHDVGGETNDVSKSGTDKQVYDTFYAPYMGAHYVGGGTDKPYFYVDYDKKVRFISLYQFNTDFELNPNDNTKLKYRRSTFAWRQEELDWFCQTLNSTPEDYAVFVLTHGPENFGEKTNDWQSLRLAEKDYLPNNILEKIVNAFINRTTINESFSQTTSVICNINVSYDFSDSVGLFAGFLNGHMHDDFVGKTKFYSCNQLNKCCDNLLYQSGSSIGHVKDTYNENTINVVSIDTDLRTIAVFRIGAKYSYNGDFRNVTMLNY